MANPDLSPQPASPPPRSSEAVESWAELADVVLALAREIQAAGYLDRAAVALSQQEAVVMRQLHRSGPVAPSELAAATGLQRTNLSAALRGLETKGLVERQASDQDRRGVLVRRTARGESNFALVRREWGELLASAESPDRADPHAAVDLLQHLVCALVQQRREGR
ncbi:MarR family winged helix-turn-helix transcriptional regulator [Mesorhizobium sp. PL10]